MVLKWIAKLEDRNRRGEDILTKSQIHGYDTRHRQLIECAQTYLLFSAEDDAPGALPSHRPVDHKQRLDFDLRDFVYKRDRLVIVSVKVYVSVLDSLWYVQKIHMLTIRHPATWLDIKPWYLSTPWKAP